MTVPPHLLKESGTGSYKEVSLIREGSLYGPVNNTSSKVVKVISRKKFPSQPVEALIDSTLYSKSQIFSLIREVRKVFEDTLDSKSLNKDEIKAEWKKFATIYAKKIYSIEWYSWEGKTDEYYEIFLELKERKTELELKSDSKINLLDSRSKVWGFVRKVKVYAKNLIKYDSILKKKVDSFEEIYKKLKKR